ncbi:hypothetical protein [uncultured Roseobacter sp.]|uniref:hypothetical protein n=1 Tax=uncultured Roseobacter sp. TaxID=114847 RepID=UPI002604AEDB|nr:hypothetical protein [uncultured Roseobacter sp.]
MNVLMKFAAVLSATYLTGCASTMTQDSATTNEVCRAWGERLPTRSTQDTQQTQDEIQTAYAAFSLACPDWVHLIP